MANKIIEIKVNGFTHEIAADAVTSLADVLREDLGLLGVKKGCGRGQCGCCTVLMDGRAVSSCLVLAVEAHQREIVTTEGVAAQIPEAKALGEALLESGAADDGFAAPGLMVSAASLARSGAADDDEIAVCLSGNTLTRSGYDQVVRAVKAAGKES